MIETRRVDPGPKERKAIERMYWKKGKKRETYELVYPMTIRRISAALVVADDVATDLLVVVVVGV